MFIRKKKKLDPSTGKAYFVYQLVESVRTDRGPRQRILLSLSPKLNLPEEQHKDLANRIEEIFTGAHSLFKYSEEVESIAQAYASQLINHDARLKTQPKQETDYQTIDLETIEQQEPRTVGNEHLLLRMAEQLELPKILKELGLSQRDVALSLGTIFGRAISPSSERATYTWLVKNSGLGELIDFDFSSTSLDHLYKVSDTLLTHKEALERHLSKAQAGLHGYQSTMVLYDLTNTYMEGQAKSNPKAARGHSKEKRTDCPLVTLGLVINEHGFASRSSILPGNIVEASTLEKMLQSLDSADDLFKPIIILDAGIATEENLDWLRAHHYKYVVSARQQAPSLELAGELVYVDDSKEQIKVALIQSEDDGDRWLYCESKAKEAVASKMKTFFQKRFEADLKKMAEGLLKPRGRKKYGKILERIGRLKERHSRISGCYEITVHRTADGEEASEVLWKVFPEKIETKLNGQYFLRTNITDIEPTALWKLYNSIRTVEDAFRFMKSDLGMRPVYHQKERRVDGHLWITLLAYHLIKSCLYQLEQAEIFHHWETIRNIMSSRVRVTMRARTEMNEIIYHRSTTKAEDHQQKIYQTLGLKTQILKSKKFVG